MPERPHDTSPSQSPAPAPTLAPSGPQPDISPEIHDETARTDQDVPAVSGILGRVIDRVGMVFAIGFILAMAILIYEIFMRHVFNSPTLWVHETTTFLSALGFVFGGLYCAARDRHIRVVLLYDLAGPRMRRILDIAISLICALATGFFAWASWLMVRRAAFTPAGDVHLETTGSAFDAPYPGLLKIFLLVVMIALTAQFLVLAFNYLRRAAPAMTAKDAISGDGR